MRGPPDALVEAAADEPAVRGRVIQKIAGRIDELAQADFAFLRDQHGPTLRAMSRADANGWYPQAKVMPVLETLAARLGLAGYFDFHREGVRRAMQGPLLSAVHDGSLRLFALEPHGVLPHAPHLWLDSLRNCGHFEPVEFPGEHQAKATLRAVPKALVGPAFLEAARAQLAAVLDICKCPGQVEIVQDGRGSGPWVFDARW